LGRKPGQWHVSSRSSTGTNGDCVEAVLRAPSEIGLRDSVHRDRAELALPAHQWVALLRIAGRA